jgi:hypothetical protein
MTRRIYHAVTTKTEEWDFDPKRGASLIARESIQPSGAEIIQHGDLTFELQPDGCFELPDDVAAFYRKQPGWYEGPNPFVQKRMAEEAAAAREPRAERKSRKRADDED